MGSLEEFKTDFEILREKYGETPIQTGNSYHNYWAVSCDKFETFETMKDFANKNNLDIIMIAKKNGENLWENLGNRWEPYELDEGDFSGDYQAHLIEKMDEDDFVNSFVKEEIEFYFDNDLDLNDLELFIIQVKKIFGKIEKMEEHQIAVVYNNEVVDVLETLTPMFWSDDNDKCFSYALISDACFV